MNPQDVGKAYDQLTPLWSPERFNLNNGIAQHQRALAFASHCGKALDVGCGATGRFITLLLQAGFHPEGVDISAEMLKQARIQHPQITFHAQDICTWELPDTYAFISAWDSLWHIPLAQQEQVFRKLLMGLEPQGILIFSCGGLDVPAEHTDAQMGLAMYYASLGITGFLQILLAQGCTLRHLEYDQYPEKHVYLIAQKIE